MSSHKYDYRFNEPDTLFFVIGAQKCGTTWLAKYFGEHPEICMPVWKEHDYWSSTIARPRLSNLLQKRKARRDREGQVLAWLRDFGLTRGARMRRGANLAILAAQSPGVPHTAYADSIFAQYRPAHRAAGEVSPSYALLEPDRFQEMAELADNVRFIFVMRDPVARFISGILHSFRRKGAAATLTDAQMGEEIDLRLSQRQMDSAVALSRYDLTMAALEKTIPPDRISYSFFETLFQQDQLDDICAFLGVGSHPASFDRVSNPGASKQVVVDDAQRKRIAQILAPAYHELDHRFGDQLPKKWRDSMAFLER